MLDWVRVSARAISDGDGLAGSGSVSVSTHGEGGALWAIGGVDVSGDSSPNGGVIPARSPS